jgi:uncharacterized protein YciI
MFIVSLTYVAPLEEIDAVLSEHVAFLENHYATGTFVASGRKVPRTGGIILAEAEDEAALRAVLAEDPFARRGLATYDIQEFVVSKARRGLEALMLDD